MLEEIVTGVRADLEGRRERTPITALEAALPRARPVREVRSRLRRPEGVQVIAEVKRRSPSRGDLARIPDPVALAQEYAAAGAALVSVLTEERRFGGSVADLSAVTRGVDVAVLRKDFVVDPYQVLEARVHGADVVLLIVAALAQDDLVRLGEQIRALGMTSLVEVHDEAEVDRALAAGADVIGVNARDLRTLAVDPGTVHRLLPLLPAGVVRVAESGVAGPQDVRDYARSGADAVLVGEALVTGSSPGQLLRELLAAGRTAPVAS